MSLEISDYRIKFPSNLFPTNLRDTIWSKIKELEWENRHRVLEDDGYQGNIHWGRAELDPWSSYHYRELFTSNLSDTLGTPIAAQECILSLQKIKHKEPFGIHFDRDIASIQCVIHGDRHSPVKFYEEDPRQTYWFNKWGNFPVAKQEVTYNDDVFYLNTTKWHDNKYITEDRYLIRFIFNERMEQKVRYNYEWFRKRLNEIL